MFRKVVFTFFILAIMVISLSTLGCLPDMDASQQAVDGQTPVTVAVTSSDNFSFFTTPPTIVDRADTVLALNTTEYTHGKPEQGSRKYPYGSLAGALLGFRGKHGQGLYGIEYLCDTIAVQGMQDVFSNALEDKRFVLTISKDIQLWAENDLQRQMKRLGAESGALVMMDINSGEILAMASMPEWNPGNAWDRPDHEFVNHAIEDEIDAWMFFPILECLKLHTLAEANATSTGSGREGDPHGDILDNGDTMPNIEVLFSRKGRRKWSWGNITDNLVLWSPWDHEVVKQLNFYSSAVRDMWKMGLGQDTGLKLSREKTGSLPFITPGDWDSVAFNNVKATPVQVLRAFSAIISAGNIAELTIAKTARGNTEQKTLKSTGVDWLTKDAAAWMLEGLALNDGPSIAAIKIKDTGRADHAPDRGCSQVVSLGFWPEQNPMIAYISMLENTTFDPRVRRGTLGKTIKIAKKACCLLKEELKPTMYTAKLSRAVRMKARDKNSAIMPDLRGVTMRQAIKNVMNTGLAAVVRGSGLVTEQYPAPGTSIKGIHKCTIVCNGWAGLT